MYFQYFSVSHTSSSVLSIQNMSFAEMGPGGGHHWIRLGSKLEVILLLVVLDSLGQEDWCSLLWIIFKLALSHGHVINGLFTEFVVSSYLVQSVLSTKGFVFQENSSVFFFVEAFRGFWNEVFSPALGMVPVTLFKLVPLVIINNCSFNWFSFLALKCWIVDCVEPTPHLSNSKVGLSHFKFFICNTEHSFLVGLMLWVWELLVTHRSLVDCWTYTTHIVS